MAYHDDFKAALIKWLGPEKVVFLPGWDKKYRGLGWQGKNGKPVALMNHHTAAAATDSTNPAHPGNQKGANKGVIDYVNHHFTSPASNCTLDRDGIVYVNTAYPCWHSGEGSFRGVIPFDSLGVPDDRFADVGLGVEIVSKGLKKDFTKAQKDSAGALANACKEASDWKGIWKRLPNHSTWAPTRKIDTRYSLSELRTWSFTAALKRVFGRS